MAAITVAKGATTEYTGAVQTAVAGEVIGDFDAIKIVNGVAMKAKSTPTESVADVMEGLAVSAATKAGQAILFVGNGTVKAISSGQTKGDPVYLGAAAGKLDDAAPAAQKSITLVGFWLNATDLRLSIFNTGIIK